MPTLFPTASPTPVPTIPCANIELTVTYEWFQGVPPTSPSTDDLFFTVGGSTRAVSVRSSTETFTPGDSITFADTSNITIVANYSGVDNFGFADCSIPAGCITFLSAVGLDSNSVDEQAATVTVTIATYIIVDG